MSYVLVENQETDGIVRTDLIVAQSLPKWCLKASDAGTASAADELHTPPSSAWVNKVAHREIPPEGVTNK